jgi:hypothetical protein
MRTGEPTWAILCLCATRCGSFTQSLLVCKSAVHVHVQEVTESQTGPACVCNTVHRCMGPSCHACLFRSRSRGVDSFKHMHACMHASCATIGKPQQNNNSCLERNQRTLHYRRVRGATQLSLAGQYGAGGQVHRRPVIVDAADTVWRPWPMLTCRRTSPSRREQVVVGKGATCADVVTKLLLYENITHTNCA